MADFEFAYAGSAKAGLPSVLNRPLPGGDWRVTAWQLDATDPLPQSPDFWWVDFGEAPKLDYAETVISRLAGLEKSTSKRAFFFISGTALPETAHDTLVNRIYATFHDPTNVVADLVGQPDLSAAIAKFLAQRKVRAELPKPGVASIPLVRVPNADLRSDRGRLSIRPIAELFGMDVIEIGRLVGRPNKAALSKTPDAESLQELLQPFADIASLRAPDFGNDQFRKWLNTPNAHMQNRAPLAWIREGRIKDVAGFAFGLLTGQPT